MIIVNLLKSNLTRNEMRVGYD